MICNIDEKEIIKQIDNKEIFEAICKIKKIDYDNIVRKLIDRIRESDIEDKDIYMTEHEIWDSEYIRIIREEDVLFINNDLLWSKEEAIKFFKNDYGDQTETELKYIWIETTDEEKEIIKIAMECKIESLHVLAER